jgi:hypothetical protein
MTDKKDDRTSGPSGTGPSGTGPAKPGDRPADANKRPQAVIQGKAVEIAATTIRPDPKPEAAEVDAAKSDAAKSDAAGKPTGPAKPAAGASTAPPARRRGGLGALLTHLAAGVVGGATAWYGVTALGPELGLVPPPPAATATRILEEKVAALERRLTAAPPATAAGGDVAAKLAALQADVTKLQAAARTAGEVATAQAKLAADVEALAKQGPRGADPDAAQRLAKLEDRLRLLSDAAAKPDAGQVPQLVALTGRLADLETTLANQLAALRKTVAQEVETRLTATAETSEAARSGANRLDREVATVKSEAATLTSRLDALKADADRLSAAVQTLRSEDAALRTAVETARVDVDTRLKGVAKPADVASAIAPVAGRIAALDQGLQAVVKAEEDRRATAERVVLALELGTLKRVIDRGQRFAAELANVRAAAATAKVDLTMLDRHKDTGLPTLADLTREFSAAAAAMLDSERAPAGGSVLDRVLASAQSVVRIRRTDHAADDRSVEAIVGRMEAALKDGRIADAAAESRTLPPKAAGAAQAYLVKLESRAAVDAAIAALEAGLKSSLTAKPTSTN